MRQVQISEKQIEMKRMLRQKMHLTWHADAQPYMTCFKPQLSLRNDNWQSNRQCESIILIKERNLPDSKTQSVDCN